MILKTTILSVSKCGHNTRTLLYLSVKGRQPAFTNGPVKDHIIEEKD